MVQINDTEIEPYRVAPNDVCVADWKTFQLIYSQGTDFMKVHPSYVEPKHDH